jgi:hypothetical protein
MRFGHNSTNVYLGNLQLVLAHYLQEAVVDLV